MSYNTRRGGSFAPANSAASVGQRRPPSGNSQQSGFTPAASQNPNPTNKPGLQTPVQQQPAQGATQRQPQQQPSLQQLQHQQQNLQAPVRQSPMQQGVSQKPLQQQPTAQQQRPPQQMGSQEQGTVPQAPITVFKSEDSADMNTNGNEVEELGAEAAVPRRKPFWMRPGGRVNKKERLRRRNERLRKILQPKNALMVLNELVGSTAYNVSETADTFDGLFKCMVTVDGKEHVGVGKSKPGAKGSAAEAALKHLVLTRFKSTELQNASVIEQALDVSCDEKMEINSDAEAGSGGGISWSHVASYALHKLLTDWDEGANITEKLSLTSPPAPPKPQVPQVKKPAKKLPDNASTMNPIMLLNQMQPNAVYENVSESGNGPHAQFTVKCIINEEEFLATASNKKNARKLCAFSACIKVLGIQYPQSFLEEHSVTFDASGNITYAPKTTGEAMQVAQSPF